jgi:hypothetical protein
VRDFPLTRVPSTGAVTARQVAGPHSPRQRDALVLGHVPWCTVGAERRSLLALERSSRLRPSRGHCTPSKLTC